MTTAADVKRAEAFLVFVRHARESWDSLHRCRVCGQYWEMSHPGAGDVCCVEPTLQKLSETDAVDKYGIGKVSS